MAAASSMPNAALGAGSADGRHKLKVACVSGTDGG